MRPPLSIRLAAALWSLLGASSIWKGVTEYSFNGRTVISVVFGLLFYGYLVIGTIKLSRIPVVFCVLIFAVAGVWRASTGLDLSAKPAPWGMLSYAVPALIFGALILPHWKRLSWRPFGPVASAKSVNVEVFS